MGKREGEQGRKDSGRRGERYEDSVEQRSRVEE